LPGRRYFKDFDETITKLYGLKIPGGYKPMTILLDRSMRVVAAEPLRRTAHVLDLMRRCMAEERPTLGDRFGSVLTVPRIFEPSFCKRLIDYYENDGGAPSGFMRQIDGKTVGIHDLTGSNVDGTRRSGRGPARPSRGADQSPASARHRTGLQLARHPHRTLYRRLLFQRGTGASSTATATTRHSGTAHRKFAVSINLNAEDFEGGELRFPEFGPIAPTSPRRAGRRCSAAVCCMRPRP
jgi:hypothetical protein